LPQRAASRAAWLGLATGLLVALLVWAPASWLALGIQGLSGGRVQLTNPQGTVWQGRAGLVLSGGVDSQDLTRLPGGLHWQLTPGWGSSISDGPQLHLSLQAPCCTPEPMQVSLSPRWTGLSVALQAHRSEWPAALLVGLGTPWNTLQLQAALKLSTPGIHLSWSPGQMQAEGSAVLDVLDASTVLSTLRPMGSYHISWQAAPNGAQPRMELSTLSGELQLQGSGEWIGRRLRFRGEAQAAPGREDALANLMNILGRRQGAKTLITIG
jgi:general secretion pathway protein N